jgi:Restriction endonuclease
MKDSQAIADLANILYHFLPGSGNARLAFPIAAAQAGVERYWIPGSKRPAITQLLQETYNADRHRFCPLIEAIVRQSLTWSQGKGAPMRRDEIDALNAVLLRLGFKIPELYDPRFLAGLAGSTKPVPAQTGLNATLAAELQRELIELAQLSPTMRGLRFEHFLTELFAAFGLAPKGSIRLIGEQIDGSFELDRDVYLIEAKWQADCTSNAHLLTFSGKVARKAEWSRGLFVSYSGFTEDGLAAFAQGKQTNIICMDGRDLFHVLAGKLDLRDVIARKVRAAAETNRAFVPVRDLFLNVVKFQQRYVKSHTVFYKSR